MSDITRAFQAYESGRPEEAERICRQILATSPTDPQLSWLLSHVLIQGGKAAEAEAVAALALEGNPGDAEWALKAWRTRLLTVRGEALSILGRADDAIACLMEAIDRRLINPDAHAALAALLDQRRDPTPRFTVSIITPSVGTPLLARAIESVQGQGYPLVEHFVVADGAQHHDRVRASLPREPRHPVHFLALPINIGGGGFNGHRVYGAAPFLVDGHFVAFLDEDNWFEPEHVASLMAKITAQGLSWAYALRRIVDADGQFLTNDDCESLGQWPNWNRPDLHLVDANCYMLRRDVAIAMSPLWYRRFGEMLSPDFAICDQLLKEYPRCCCCGRYTVNYRVAMTADSMSAQFFFAGNTAIRQRFGDSFPWSESRGSG
jgi:tetratricopeptide (TPR) repeat protein